MLQSTRSKNSFRVFIVFLFWPILALRLSIINRDKEWAKNIFWIFCVYYGYTFIIPNVGSDAYSYAQTFHEFGLKSISISDMLSSLFKDKNVDVLQPVISYTVSRFTNDSRILFATYALIFGYFYTNNLWYLFEKIDKKSSFILGVYILVFALICPIWRINGFRFWTATHIFLFGLLPYLLDGNKKSILISTLSIFVHFSFVLPVLVWVVYALTGNKQKLFFFIFVLTSFVNELDFGFIRSQLSFLPDIYDNKVNIYVNEGYRAFEEQNQSSNLLVANYAFLFNVVNYIFIIAIYLKRKIFVNFNAGFVNLFSFTLLFYSFSNIVDLMPQGSRFLTLAHLLTFFLIIVYMNNIFYDKTINFIKLAVMPILLIFLVVSLRMGIEFTGLLSVLGNPFLAPFVDDPKSILEIIK